MIVQYLVDIPRMLADSYLHNVQLAATVEFDGEGQNMDVRQMCTVTQPNVVEIPGMFTDKNVHAVDTIDVTESSAQSLVAKIDMDRGNSSVDVRQRSCKSGM